MLLRAGSCGQLFFGVYNLFGASGSLLQVLALIGGELPIRPMPRYAQRHISMAELEQGIRKKVVRDKADNCLTEFLMFGEVF